VHGRYAATFSTTLSRPSESYLVCALPRSGSSLLCGLLESTGVAGHAHEWFWRETEAGLRENWGTPGEGEYLERVLAAGTTPNGVFAAKLMWGYFEETLDRLRAFAGAPSAGDPQTIEAFAPRPRFVWVRRGDVVAQAVSWSRALQGGRWWSGDDRPEGPLRYDFEQIDGLIGVIHEHDAGWRSWFERNGLEPWALGYEELAADPVAITSRVLDFLGLEAEADPRSIGPRNERQADALYAEWAARYVAERAYPCA